MAIVNNKSKTAAPTAPAQQAPADHAAPTQPAQAPVTPGDLFGFTVPTQSGGYNVEDLAKFVKAIKETAAAATANKTGNFKIVVANSSELLLPIVCVVNLTPQPVVYALLIEGLMSTKLTPRKRSVFNPAVGGQVELTIDMFSGRCWDETGQKAARRAVANDLNVAEGDVSLRHHMTVPGSVEWATESMAQLCFELAMFPLFDKARDESRRLNHAALTNSAGSLVMTARYTQGSGTELNVVGERIACDVIVSTSLERKKVNNATTKATDAHRVAESFAVANTKILADFLPLAKDPMQHGIASPGAQAKPGFVPQLIITDFDGASEGGASMDLRTLVMAFLNVMPLASNYGWVNLYAGHNNKKSSLAQLGLLHDPWAESRGKAELGLIDIDHTPFGNQAEGKLTNMQVAQSWCTKGVMVGIDIDQARPNAWVGDVVTMIGNGNVKANIAFANACDALTQGAYSRIASQSNGGKLPMAFMQEQTGLLTATYTGTDGELADSRRSTLTTLIESFGGDQAVITPFIKGRLPGATEFDHEDMRRAWIDATPGFEVNGVGMRTFATPAFLSNLTQAFIEAGVRIVPDASFCFTEGGTVGVTGNYGEVLNVNGMYAQNQASGAGFGNHFGVMPTFTPAVYY